MRAAEAQGMAAKKKRGAAGRFGAINRFIDETMRSLPATAALVWLVLWRDERGGTVTASYGSLRERTGRSRRAVAYALDQLEAAGLLKVVRRGGPGAGPNVYRLYSVPR